MIHQLYTVEQINNIVLEQINNIVLSAKISYGVCYLGIGLAFSEMFFASAMTLFVVAIILKKWGQRHDVSTAQFRSKMINTGYGLLAIGWCIYLFF